MIDFSNITAVALGVEEVIQIEDSLGTVLWQKAQPLANYFYVEDISGNDNTVYIQKTQNAAPTIEPYYSTDQQTWTSMGTTSTSAISATVPANGKLYIKCVADTWTNYDNLYYNYISCMYNFNVGGNIMSLLYGDNFENQTVLTNTNDMAFNKLFRSALTNLQDKLINANNLLLPATTLCRGCYYGMFNNCTGLITAPALPATTLAKQCYYNMFAGCTSLTTAPALPATTMAEGCYMNMFNHTGLTTAPALPATDLTGGKNCYYLMFYACHSLTQAPALPATTLAEGCYREMFNSCTRLTTAPALPATTLTNYCYRAMFLTCSSLTQAPATLPATTLASDSCASMFKNCTSLTTTPVIMATTYNSWSANEMFDGCTSLNTVTTYANTLQSNATVSWLNNVAQTGDFYALGSASWTIDSPSGVPVGWTLHHSLPVPCNVSISSNGNGTVSVNGVSGDYSATVMSGTQLTLVATPAAGYQFDSWSDGDTNASRTITVSGAVTLTASFVQAQPVGEPFYIEDASGNANTLSITKGDALAPTIEVFSSTDGTNWSSMGTTSTAPITATVPANGKLYLKATADQWANQNGINTNENNIDCSGNYNIGGNIMSLLVADNYTNATLDTNYYYQFRRLFFQSTHLLDASDLELPNNTSTGCYTLMFSGCTNMTTAPALPATTLTQYCYSSMFTDCSSLTTAPALPATTLPNYCYYFMFARCTSLTTAPALPATSLAQGCYSSMFANCSSLTTAPALPATSLAQACYEGMFWGCTSLTAAPALPATALAMACYEDMFTQCSSLTQAPVLAATTLAIACYDKMFRQCTSLTAAPALPATTLVERCYVNMFQDCTSLTETPVLPATTLTQSCYAGMFQGCSSLNKVYTYADDISASNCINNWLNNVAATGDFYNLGTATYTLNDPSGVPTGWTYHTSL